jgi:hypothetical protein
MQQSPTQMQTITSPSITHHFSNGDQAKYEPSKNLLTIRVKVNDEKKNTSGEEVSEIHGVFTCEFLPGAVIKVNNGSMFFKCDPINQKTKEVIFGLSDGRKVLFIPYLNQVVVIEKNLTRICYTNVTNCRMDSTGSVDWDSTIPVPVQVAPPTPVAGPTIGKNYQAQTQLRTQIQDQALAQIQAQSPIQAQPTVHRSKEYKSPNICRYWYETGADGRQILCCTPAKLKTRTWDLKPNDYSQSKQRILSTNYTCFQ